MYLHAPTLWAAFRATFSRRHFEPHHVAWTIILSLLFLLLWLTVQVFRAIDYVAFPAFRKQPVERPIFIIGNPRSGTTFLHRLISIDSQFSTTKLVHTILPAVSLYRCVRLARSLDRKLGSPLSRLISSLTSRAFGGWSGIHRTRLRDPEEDEQLFVYSLLTPVISLLFPFFEEIPGLKYLDHMSVSTRQRVMKGYVRSLQRHLYAVGRDSTLLVKNTSVSGRLHSTIAVLPDIRIVHIVRHPFETIPSLLSMYNTTWRRLVPNSADDVETNRALAFLFCDYYRYRLEALRSMPADQVVHVPYQDLVSDPEGTIREIYGTFGIELTEAYGIALRKAARQSDAYRSSHRYTLDEFGLTKANIRDRLGSSFHEYGFDAEATCGSVSARVFSSGRRA